MRARKAVVRKGRENYLCLLNLQEQVNAAMSGGGAPPPQMLSPAEMLAASQAQNQAAAIAAHQASLNNPVRGQGLVRSGAQGGPGSIGTSGLSPTDILRLPLFPDDLGARRNALRDALLPGGGR